jgi:hypothetical protein
VWDWGEQCKDETGEKLVSRAATIISIHIQFLSTYQNTNFVAVTALLLSAFSLYFLHSFSFPFYG